MTAAIILILYILTGFVVLMKKFEHGTAIERRIWSPLQSLALLLLWPIVLFMD
jgi:hypothetical protein